MTSFTSYRELAKAKRTHTTVIGSPTGSAATRSFSGPTVPHPCIKPTPGPEFREWKYQTHSFVSEGSEKLIGGYTSNQDLNHEKHLGQVQIPLDTIIPSKKAPLDPTKPRFDSLREMKRMKKYHASAIYPSAAAMTSEVRSRSVDASPLASNKSCSMWAKQHSETNEWSSWVPQDAKNSQEFLSNQKKLCTREFKSPPTATPGPIKNDQGLYLSQDKVKNDKLLPGGTQLQSSNTRCKSPSQTHLLKDRHVSQLDFASEKHVHQTGIGERDGSSSPYSRNSFSKKTDMKAAGMVHSPTNVVLFKSDGSNYPIAEPTTPSHLRRDSFKHTSHDQLHIEKQTSSTPIYPVTPPVRDPPHGSPTLSQRRVEREIKVHVRPIDQQVGDDRFESGKCSSPHRTHRKLIPSPSGSPLPKSPCRSPVSPGRISYNSPSYKPGSHYGEAVPPPRSLVMLAAPNVGELPSPSLPGGSPVGMRSNTATPAERLTKVVSPPVVVGGLISPPNTSVPFSFPGGSNLSTPSVARGTMSPPPHTAISHRVSDLTVRSNVIEQNINHLPVISNSIPSCSSYEFEVLVSNTPQTSVNHIQSPPPLSHNMEAVQLVNGTPQNNNSISSQSVDVHPNLYQPVTPHIQSPLSLVATSNQSQSHPFDGLSVYRTPQNSNSMPIYSSTNQTGGVEANLSHPLAVRNPQNGNSIPLCGPAQAGFEVPATHQLLVGSTPHTSLSIQSPASQIESQPLGNVTDCRTPQKFNSIPAVGSSRQQFQSLMLQTGSGMEASVSNPPSSLNVIEDNNPVEISPIPLIGRQSVILSPSSVEHIGLMRLQLPDEHNQLLLNNTNRTLPLPLSISRPPIASLRRDQIEVEGVLYSPTTNSVPNLNKHSGKKPLPYSTTRGRVVRVSTIAGEQLSKEVLNFDQTTNRERESNYTRTNEVVINPLVTSTEQKTREETLVYHQHESINNTTDYELTKSVKQVADDDIESNLNRSSGYEVLKKELNILKSLECEKESNPSNTLEMEVNKLRLQLQKSDQRYELLLSERQRDRNELNAAHETILRLQKQLWNGGANATTRSAAPKTPKLDNLAALNVQLECVTELTKTALRHSDSRFSR